MTTPATVVEVPNQTPQPNPAQGQVPNPAPAPQAPQQVVTPVKYSGEPEELKKLLEKVRKEEKMKLYPQIDHLKKQNSDLLKDKETLAMAFAAKDEEVNKASQKKMTELEKIQEQMKMIADQNAELLTKQRLMEEETRRQQEYSRLMSYRAEAIRLSGGESTLIPEMVIGNTEAEIDENIIRAKRRFADIKAQVDTNYMQNLSQTPVPGMTNPPANPGGQPNNRQGAEEITAEQIADMSDEEWEKHRLDIRGAADRSMKNFFGGGR